MSRPGIEPGPPAQEASTLEKSHLDNLSAGYSEPLLGLRRNIRPLHLQAVKIILHILKKIVFINFISSLAHLDFTLH
jgi:hypothetical protein